MAALSSSFTGPATTASAPYVAGVTSPTELRGGVIAVVTGEWASGMSIVPEYSTDSGATWTPLSGDYGFNPKATARDADWVRYAPPSPGVFRLRCANFTSGNCQWSIFT